MLPGTRVMVDVDPIQITSNPAQLAAVLSLLAALRQAEAQRPPSASPQQDLASGEASLAEQLLPEVIPVLRSCRGVRECPRACLPLEPCERYALGPKDTRQSSLDSLQPKALCLYHPIKSSRLWDAIQLTNGGGVRVCWEHSGGRCF